VINLNTSDEEHKVQTSSVNEGDMLSERSKRHWTKDFEAGAGKYIFQSGREKKADYGGHAV
jgi:hypothetical protein